MSIVNKIKASIIRGYLRELKSDIDSYEKNDWRNKINQKLPYFKWTQKTYEERKKEYGDGLKELNFLEGSK